jgi:hypothetical protein
MRPLDQIKGRARAGQLKTHFSPLFHTISHFKKKTAQGQAETGRFFFRKQALSVLLGSKSKK